MRIYEKPQIVFQEVPNEVSLCYTVMGCAIHCSGCHSPHLWNKNKGNKFTNNDLIHDLYKYGSFITCVLFFGGEWHEEELIEKLIIIRERFNLKTCLYTGLDTISDDIALHLNYLKVGPWIDEYGGLDKTTTNQLFYNLDKKIIINDMFVRDEEVKE